MPTPVVTLRGATTGDALFLAQLMAHGGRGRVAKFDSSGDLIITSDDESIGRIWVHCDGADWELVDIVVLPEHRGHRVGTVLLKDLIHQADANAATVHLSVGTTNAAAQRLFFGLGFAATGTNETHLRLSLPPSTLRKERFEKFRRAVLTDTALQARMRELGRDGFALAVTEIGREAGYEFDAADARDALRDAKSEWITRWV
jgi:ribosomal protein S18 acetylase RimI-like enzyme